MESATTSFFLFVCLCGLSVCVCLCIGARVCRVLANAVARQRLSKMFSISVSKLCRPKAKHEETNTKKGKEAKQRNERRQNK